MQLPILPDSPEPPSEGDSNDGRSGPGAPVSGELLSALLEEIHHQIRGALLYTHHRAERNTETLADLAATVQAVLAVLVEQGIIRPEELDKRRREAAVLIKKQFKDRGMGAIRLVPEIDKYDFKSNSKVDCASRLHVCRAACCRMPFALSKQDIQEGVIQWNLAHPYVVKHGEDGFCVHRDAETCHCSAYDQRPVACRAFDCTDDERIWADFEAMKLTPELEALYAQQDHDAASADCT